ncbi:MAG: hypothetical protein ACI4MK_08230 [Aristaeellaceae bacterium]
MSKNRNPFAEEAEDYRPLNREQKKIRAWLRTVHFRRRLFGGVSERDVWRKLEELNNMYNLALEAERIRYDALLEQAERNAPDAGADTNSNEREGV